MATRSNNAPTDSFSNKVLNQWLPAVYNTKPVQIATAFSGNKGSMENLYKASATGSVSDVWDAQKRVVANVVAQGLLNKGIRWVTAKPAKILTNKVAGLFKSDAEKAAEAAVKARANKNVLDELRELTKPKYLQPAIKNTLDTALIIPGAQGVNKFFETVLPLSRTNPPSTSSSPSMPGAVYNPLNPPVRGTTPDKEKPKNLPGPVKPGTTPDITKDNNPGGAGAGSGSGNGTGNTTNNNGAGAGAGAGSGAAPGGSNNSTGNTAGQPVDQGGTITMDMSQTDEAARAASAAAAANYNANLASLAQQSYANQISLRDALATNMQQSQGQAADIYGGTAPALLGQFLTGDQRGYVQGLSAETQRNTTQQNALLRSYNENVSQIAQAKSNAYASAAAKRAALAAQIQAMG